MTPDDVRDIFERALLARSELERKRHRLEALRSPVLSSGIARAVHGGAGDPTATAASALADEGGDLARMEAEYLGLRSELSDLVEGVRDGLGTIYGDLLSDHYLDGRSWDVASRINGVGKTTALRYRDVAFDWVASVGIAHAKRGEGGRLSDPRTA